MMKERYKEKLEKYDEIKEEGVMVCPYCGYEHEFSAVDFGNVDSFDDDATQCSKCQLYFGVEGLIKREFWATTRPLPVDRRD